MLDDLLAIATISPGTLLFFVDVFSYFKEFPLDKGAQYLPLHAWQSLDFLSKLHDFDSEIMDGIWISYGCQEANVFPYAA